MSSGLVWLLLFIAVVIVYTVARVIALNRRSKIEWSNTDKSKLREWDDDDEWGS